MSQQIDQLITLLQEMKSKLSPKLRLEELTEEIKKTQGLEHLFVDDPRKEYPCSKYTNSTEFNHLQKCVILTSKFKFLEEYIDLYLIEHPETINHKNKKGLTALMIAASNSNCTSTERTVEILLNHGADVNSQENDGYTALIYAVRYCNTDSSEKTVELLLNHDANINIQNNYDNNALYFALQNYGRYGKKGTVKLIIEKMDNCDITIDNKKLVKYLFDKDFTDDIIELAIQKGAKRSDIVSERLYKLLQL